MRSVWQRWPTRTTADARHPEAQYRRAHIPESRPRARVCMHALTPVRRDVRARRAALALASAGYSVKLIDVEHGAACAQREALDGRALLALGGAKDVQALHTNAARSQRRSTSVADKRSTGFVSVSHIFVPSQFERHYQPTHYVQWLLFKFWRMARAILRVAREPADIYHACDITGLPACFVASSLRRKPLVLDAYEIPLAQAHIVRSHALHAVATQALRMMIKRCAAIIVVSPPIASEVRRRFGGVEACVIRNIPPYSRPAQTDRLRTALRLSPSSRLALYQGALIATRGLGVLVSAARYLDPQTVIVLMGEGSYRGELEAMAARLGVEDKVRIIPAVPYEHLLEWTASADIGLVIFQTRELSYHLSLPNKVFEYLMAGLPVLASPLPAVEEIVRTYDAGAITTSARPEAIAQAINQLIGDSGRLARLRSNALRASAGELQWEVERQRLITLYEDALRQR